jgi:hypothetical protein
MEVTVAFIDGHRKTYGVEPICGVLPIAPSTYFRHTAHQADPTRRSARAQRDDELRAIIRRTWTEQVRARCGCHDRILDGHDGATWGRR